MSNVTPEQMLKITSDYAKALKLAAKSEVVVGLPKENASAAIYKTGETVFQIGAQHEYGHGNIPRRSFLLEPFDIHKDKIKKQIDTQFKDLAKGKKVNQALGLIGVAATNLSKGAFATGGYGKWQDISQSTKDLKGSSSILIDTGTLRRSITYAVRGA